MSRQLSFTGNLLRIYAEQPKGWEEKGKETWVYKLQKSLYSLKQPGHCWYTRLYNEMCKSEFTRVSVDHSVFVKKDNQGSAMVTLHISNMAAMANNTMTLECTIMPLWWIIDLIDMGPIKWFLGMCVSRNCRLGRISLSQGAYIDTVLRRFGMTDAYGVSMPLDLNVILSMTMSPSMEKQKAPMQKIPYLAGVRSHVCLNGYPSQHYFCHQQTQPIQL